MRKSTSETTRVTPRILITQELLHNHDACEEQAELFANSFPNGAEVTLETVRKGIRAGLNLDWARANLLSPPARKAYDEAIAAAFVDAWVIHEAWDGRGWSLMRKKHRTRNPAASCLAANPSSTSVDESITME